MINKSRTGIHRRDLLIGSAALLAAGAAGVIPRRARAQGTKVLKCAHTEMAESSVNKAMLMIRDKVRERTGGSVDIQVHPAGQLGGYRDIIEGMRLGTIDLGVGGGDQTANVVPQMLVAVLYYIWRSPEHAGKVLQGEVGEKLAMAMSKKIGIRVTAWSDFGMRNVFTTGRQITSVADMKGLKIRVPESRHHVLAMKALGANPTPVAYAEVYTALQTGVVEAAEGTPAAIMQMRFNEPAKYMSMTQHQLLIQHGLISERTVAKLTKSELQHVFDASREAFDWQRKESVKENAAAFAEIKKSGVKVIDIPDLEPFRNVVKPTWKELIDPVEGGWDLIKQIEAQA